MLVEIHTFSKEWPAKRQGYQMEPKIKTQERQT